MGSAPTKVSDTWHLNENEKICSLFKAINNNNFKRARKLITAGVTINCINYYGATPLIETCRGTRSSKNDTERENFVRFLVASGCDINRSDINGWTALLYATERGYDSIAMLLERLERKKSICYFENEGDDVAVEEQKNSHRSLYDIREEEEGISKMMEELVMR